MFCSSIIYNCVAHHVALAHGTRPEAGLVSLDKILVNILKFNFIYSSLMQQLKFDFGRSQTIQIPDNFTGPNGHFCF